jgi:hypothetical protein
MYAHRQLTVTVRSRGDQMSAGVLRKMPEQKVQCFPKVAVHLQKVLEVMCTSVYTGLNPFNFIREQFLQICVRKVAVHL